MPRYHKNFFKPKNPQKYKGRLDQIVYRSSWEHQVMRWLDSHPDVIQWASEEPWFCIPYVHPLKPANSNIARYFPDFYVKMKTKEGQIKEMLIEVKPKKETLPPSIVGGRRAQSKKSLYAATTYAINSAKWQTAAKYCKARGWDFKILTEEDINHLRQY